ncbi:MAG TPA: ABC transporter permease subunit [Candidatus Limnocylindria bacterium]|nr:ABC transporter permease subunit [Candidatus Limnocylindria bacterium]
MTAPSLPERHGAAVPLWRDVRVLRLAGQAAVVLAIALLLFFLGSNLVSTMAERNLRFGFGFLDNRAGFEIGESPFPYSADDTYAQAYLVGVLNTLFVGVVGIILATLLGIVVGVARLSTNWLVSQVAGVYVEIIRNTPLLVQLFFIYFVVLLQLPQVRDTIALPGSVFLNQRGLFIPAPQLASSFPAWVAVAVAAIVLAIALRARGPAAIGSRALWAVPVVVVAAWILLRPVAFDPPVQGRFNFSGGMALSTSFMAILLGLVLYTAAFIGEVVRGGIQAVRRGQLEAARALGLSEGDTLRLIVFPQALRIIVPPLTSQYLNLVKNSSLAIAVGYPDLFKIGTTMTNQTGQPVPVVVLVMATYLAISLLTSLLMNLYNRRVQVLER